MSPIASKAIVIRYPNHRIHGSCRGSITVPGRNGEISMLDAVDFDSDDSSYGRPRKRRRLTHLTPDEKLIRRKLKNRVAAQTARDRKKAMMVELEEKVAVLEEENEFLKLHNFSLKEASSMLAKENATLITQLTRKQLSSARADSVTKRSAVPVPPQKELVQNLPRLATKCSIMPDNFLGLLQELAEDIKYEWAQATTSFLQSSQPANQMENSPTTSISGRMANLSSSDLGCLISVDHEYVKHQSQGMDTQQQKTPIAVNPLNTTTGSSYLPKNYNPTFIESKYQCNGILVGEKLSQFPNNFHSITPEVKHSRINSCSTPPSFPSSNVFDVDDASGIAEELINMLSNSDIITPLSVFQNNDTFHGLNTGTGTIHNTIDYKNGISMPQEGSEVIEASENEQNTSKLFNEIYEHFLSLKDSSVLDSSLTDVACNHGDQTSYNHGDQTLMPPQIFADSLHDSSWHEPSFSDLFPDLQ